MISRSLRDLPAGTIIDLGNNETYMLSDQTSIEGRYLIHLATGKARPWPLPATFGVHVTIIRQSRITVEPLV